jgi:hypothetical protein|tara:strand:- start:724 stop:1233 length:510 start_codon:yes stop_codon:yes gene_type:complete
MGAKSWNISPGLQNVGSFQVSGAPYATASVVVPASASLSGDDEGSAAATMCIRFPYVTKWFEIRVSGALEPEARAIRVGFSAEGLSDPIVNSGVKIRGGNYFTIPVDHSASHVAHHYELKVSELHLMSNHTTAFKADIVAGLTNIAVGRTEGSTGPNWSGSVGVSGQAL